MISFHAVAFSLLSNDIYREYIYTFKQKTRSMVSEEIVLGRYAEVRDGIPLKYKIQIVTPDLFDDVIEYMKVQFLTRQPMLAHDDLIEDALSVKSYESFWRKVLMSGESIVALEDREDNKINILGVNLVNARKKNQTFKEEYEGKKFNKLMKLIKVLTEKGNIIFNNHDVDKYQKSCGLSAHRDYSGYKIGYRLLAYQDVLCKQLGYKFICTIFTSKPGQYLANKLGYQTIAEEDYSSMQCDGQIAYPGLNGSAKLMYKAV